MQLKRQQANRKLLALEAQIADLQAETAAQVDLAEQIARQSSERAE